MHKDNPKSEAQLPPLQRASLYRVMAQLVLYEADGQLQQQLKRLELVPLFEALAPGVRSWLNAPMDEAELERLASLYAQLFLMGKGSVSLQASHWLEGCPERVEVIDALVHNAEPEGVSALGNLPPDHLGVLLCYLADAYESTSEEIRAMAPRLDGQLLGQWTSKLARALELRTNEPIYLALSGLLYILAPEAETQT